MAMKSLSQIVIVVCAALAATAGLAHAAEIGQIKNTAGQVFLLRNNNQQPAKPGDLIEQADVIVTGSNGSVGVTLIDNSRLSAGPNTRVEFKQFRFNPTTQEGESLTQSPRHPRHRLRTDRQAFAGRHESTDPDDDSWRARHEIRGQSGRMTAVTDVM